MIPRLGEDSLEVGLATHSSILLWGILMEGGTWWATVPKSQTYLSNFHFHFPLRGYYRILSTIPCAIQSVLVGFIYFLHVLCLVASVMSDSATPWTVACQVPLSTEFSRQEY